MSDKKEDKNNKRCQSPSEEDRQFELLLQRMQSLLLWENPYHSLTALSVFNISFWILVWTRRPISIVFFVSFILYLIRIWKTKIWPEIRVTPSEDQLEREDWLPLHPQSLTVTELSQSWKIALSYATSVIHWFIELRKKNHPVFCVLMTIIFVATGIIGQAVSGAMIVYTLLMIVLLTPGVIVHILPSKWIPTSEIILEKSTSSSSSCIGKDMGSVEPSDVNQTNTPSLSSAAENVIQMISSHFGSTSSSSSSTPVSIPSSPHRGSTPSSDDESDPFVMVTESDIEKEFLLKTKKS